MGFDGLTPGGVGRGSSRRSVCDRPPARTCCTFKYYASFYRRMTTNLAHFLGCVEPAPSQRTEFRQLVIFVIIEKLLRKRTLVPANLKSIEQLTRSFAPPLSSALPAAASSSPAWKAAHAPPRS